MVSFPIDKADQKTYRVKRDLIHSQNITTDDKDKGTILFNSLNMLYEENPIKFIFQEESALGSSDDCLADLTTCKTCKDSDGDTWYEVRLPFDNKGIRHYLSVIKGVNRTAQEKGWVKARDCVLTSPLNWPGFKLAQETGKGSKDARIDYNSLTSFFKELFEDIDIWSDGVISAREMKAALKDEVLAERLGLVIAKHPSEWHVDAGLTKWQYLNEVITDNDELEEAKKQIKNMAWWDDALCSGADFPMFPDVYHLHPIAAIGQLAEITKGKGIGYNTYENSVEILTDWKKGFKRNISKQNLYNHYILKAGQKLPHIDLHVFKALIAQESAFDELAENHIGYAGMTQVGPWEWEFEAKKSYGTSKYEIRSDGSYKFLGPYDYKGDERFDAEKSIIGGMKVLNIKIRYLDRVIKLVHPKMEIRERYKLYMAAYNGGQGHVKKALLAAVKKGVEAPTWESLIEGKPNSSILGCVLPKSWVSGKKYNEILSYVDEIFKRVEQ